MVRTVQGKGNNIDKQLIDKISQLIVKCNYEELEHTAFMLKKMREVLDKHYMKQINVGNFVKFQHRGKTYTGQIIKVNRKTVAMKTDNHRKLKVPISLLIKGSVK